MKKLSKFLNIGVAAFVLAAVILTGCMTEHKQVLVKSTVFGLQVSASPTAGVMPSIQLGLVRSEYLSNPTSTNEVHAAPWTSTSTADLTPWHQTASETISTLTNPPAWTGTNAP